jgi:hypothetical protein
MTLKSKIISVLLFLIIAIVPISGCGIYSFTGISIDYSKIKTVSIAFFPDESANDPRSIGGPSNLSQLFTESLRDYFQRNTQLQLVPVNGDLHFDGEIKFYRNEPQAITTGDRANQGDEAGLMRLSIGVAVNYENRVVENESFKKEFTFFADYDPRRASLQSEEPRLIDIVFRQIIFEIFNESVANW